MTAEAQPYGGQLCAELKKLNRFDQITRKLDYEAIQQLKRADRQQTVELFRGSPYDFLQLIKTQEPAEVARRLIQQEQEQATAAAAMMFGAINI